MKKQMLSVAIALPMVLVGAGQSLAGDAVRISQVTTTPVTADTLKPGLSTTVQPVLSKPLIQSGSLVNSTYASGSDPNVPGEGGGTPRPPVGPRPPRKDILQNINGVVAPSLNSIPKNQNINNPAPAYQR